MVFSAYILMIHVFNIGLPVAASNCLASIESPQGASDGYEVIVLIVVSLYGVWFAIQVDEQCYFLSTEQCKNEMVLALFDARL